MAIKPSCFQRLSPFFCSRSKPFVIALRFVPVVFLEEVVQRAFTAGGQNVDDDTLEGLVPGGDQTGGLATLVMRERVELVEWIGITVDRPEKRNAMDFPTRGTPRRVRTGERR